MESEKKRSAFSASFKIYEQFLKRSYICSLLDNILRYVN